MKENPDIYIKFIRMNTGEDIISEISKLNLENDEESYIFINPLKIIYNINPMNGNAILALMQWIFSSICDKQEFRIYSNDIITMSDPSEQMMTYYLKTMDKFNDPRFDLITTNKKMIDQYEDEDEDEDDPTDEELEEINEMLNDIRNSKRKLH